jgi:glutamate dehydrogenase (NAD(P)+)
MMPVDVVVLAACEGAITVEQARELPARAVVAGANLGLSRIVEEVLHLHDVIVVPDFVGGCGGSASMDALFGTPQCPSPDQVLAGTGRLMQAMVRGLLDRAGSSHRTLREEAVAMSSSRSAGPGKPYGRAWSHQALAGKGHQGGQRGERLNDRPSLVVRL